MSETISAVALVAGVVLSALGFLLLQNAIHLLDQALDLLKHIRENKEEQK